MLLNVGCIRHLVQPLLNLLLRGCLCCHQVAKLKAAFQKCIREAEALKLELGRAEETLRAATGVSSCLSPPCWGLELWRSSVMRLPARFSGCNAHTCVACNTTPLARCMWIGPT
jgi:hypothetical protein